MKNIKYIDNGIIVIIVILLYGLNYSCVKLNRETNILYDLGLPKNRNTYKLKGEVRAMVEMTYNADSIRNELIKGDEQNRKSIIFNRDGSILELAEGTIKYHDMKQMTYKYGNDASLRSIIVIRSDPEDTGTMECNYSDGRLSYYTTPTDSLTVDYKDDENVVIITEHNKGAGLLNDDFIKVKFDVAQKIIYKIEGRYGSVNYDTTYFTYNEAKSTKTKIQVRFDSDDAKKIGEVHTVERYDVQGNIMNEKVYSAMINPATNKLEVPELMDDVNYIYKYDDKNNWTERIRIVNMKATSISERQLEYY